jgi:hypothetical protein
MTAVPWRRQVGRRSVSTLREKMLYSTCSERGGIALRRSAAQRASTI